MPTYRVVVQIEKDGVAVAGSPIIQSLSCAEGVEFQNALDGSGGTIVYETLPITTLDTVQLLLLRVDGETNVKFNNVSGVLPLTAGGLLLVVGAALSAASPSTNVFANNPADAGTAVTPTGLAGGA